MLAALLIILLAACQVQAAAVFAHFMVTNSENYTLSDWETDIKLAQDAHLDAFALNMAYNDPTNTKSLKNAFQAADKLDFGLFFSFDYAGNGAWPQSDVINLIEEYAAHSSYYQYHGQAFVSTFEGPASSSDWKTIKAMTGCFFVPSWSSLGAKEALELGVPDGLFSWAAWPWGPQDMNTYVDASYIQYLAGLPYMMPVSPWFFTNLPGYEKNWMWRGDHLWYDRWEEVFFLQPEFVQIISWNDYGESHYIGPLYDTAMEAFEIGDGPFNYATDMPHDGWRLLLPYVVDLYKQGTATVAEEGVVSWYRLNPATACGSGGTSGNTASQLQIEFLPADMAQDEIFYSALLGSPATVTVTIGGSTQTGTWRNKPDGGIGIYHGSVSFTGLTGDVTITVSRSGKTIAQVHGKPISNACTDGVQNWNVWVGSATAANKISATPKLTITEQVCINGTGANNFAGLCEYACEYAYCPIGACTCTAMGAEKPKPNTIDVQGYPIAGEDASYSGLCMFDCSHDFCPPSACGKVQVPLSTPTVSPFLPPACVAGTGEGNLEGLCNLGCAHGFCPINACTCTAEGALNVMEPTSDIIGDGAPGLDHSIYDPLCRYTCQRNYCPEGACVKVDEASGGSSGSSGSGSSESTIVYLGPEPWSESEPEISCPPPCSMVIAPRPLSSPTTIQIPPWSTPIAQSRLTTRTMTLEDGETTTIPGYSVVTQTVTITFPPIVTDSIPVWGITVNASQTRPSTVEMTSSIDPPLMVISLPPIGPGATASPSLTTTITPPPYPWSQTIKDTELNSKTTTWKPGSASPSCTTGCGHKCHIFCSGPCLLCPPFGGLGGSSGGVIGPGPGSGPGSGSGGDNPDEDCSTETARICSTTCIQGQTCGFDCSTTTGCSVTASSTTITGTPAPGVKADWEHWPSVTRDDPVDASLAASLDSRLSSLYGPLTVLDATTTATSTTTEDGGGGGGGGNSNPLTTTTAAAKPSVTCKIAGNLDNEVAAIWTNYISDDGDGLKEAVTKACSARLLKMENWAVYQVSSKWTGHDKNAWTASREFYFKLALARAPAQLECIQTGIKNFGRISDIPACDFHAALDPPE